MITGGGMGPRDNVQTLYGLSTDTKPAAGAGNGWAFVEIDTGKLYFYDVDGSQWIEWSGSGGGSQVETTIIPLQSVNAVSVQGLPAYLAQISGDIVAPNIGDTVTVTYDGTDYTVVAADYLGQAVMLGEASDGAPDFTNYPFMAFFAEGQQGLYCETSGSHTIKATK